jgi:hypothetical protein
MIHVPKYQMDKKALHPGFRRGDDLYEFILILRGASRDPGPCMPGR